MPHDYNPKARKFVGVPRAQVRAEIDKLVATVRKDAARIGARYAGGKISLAEFEVQMQELLKSGHIVAATVGRGGRARMTQADWGRVGAKLRSEYGYLSKLSRRIGAGKVQTAITPNRAKKYADGVIMSYHKTVRTEWTQESRTPIRVKLVQNSQEGCEECGADAALGWQAVEDMGELGTRICGNYCKCELIFSDDVEA